VMRSAGPGAAARFDPNSVEWALEELKSGDSQVRFWALKRVQQTLPSEPLRGQVVEALKALLHGDDRSLRNDAIGTLAVWGAAEAVPDLVQLLKDPDILVRQEAIRALGQLNDEQAIEPLCKLLGTELAAERTLIGMGPAVEDAVLASLDPNNERQFRAACEVLCQVGTQKSLQKLGPFYLRRMGPLHSAAWGAVNGIRRRGQASGEAVAQSGPQSAVPGSRFDGIDVVAGALANLKSNEPQEIRSACDLLARAQPDPQRREEVARALVHATGYPDELVRFAAVNALVVWHTPETFSKVVELTKDNRPQIRQAAIRMLGQMKTKAAVEALLDCFARDTHSVVEALTAIGPPAEGAILRRMDSPPMRDMNQAYSLLCKIGTEKCVKKLREVSSERPNLENQSRCFAALMALRWWEQFGSAVPQDQGKAGETATLGDDAATSEAKPRTWTDSTGEFKIEATLLGLKDGQVTLERTDGRVVALPLERLSKADQEFVKKATAKPGD
jgi:HEAT repeat protein